MTPRQIALVRHSWRQVLSIKERAAELRTQGKNQLLVVATDLNVSLTAELQSTNVSEGGLTLGAKNLYELIANAPGDEIAVQVQGAPAQLDYIQLNFATTKQ